MAVSPVDCRDGKEKETKSRPCETAKQAVSQQRRNRKTVAGIIDSGRVGTDGLLSTIEDAVSYSDIAVDDCVGSDNIVASSALGERVNPDVIQRESSLVHSSQGDPTSA